MPVSDCRDAGGRISLHSEDLAGGLGKDLLTGSDDDAVSTLKSNTKRTLLWGLLAIPGKSNAEMTFNCETETRTYSDSENFKARER